MGAIANASLTLAASIVGAVGLVALGSLVSDWFERRRAARRVLRVVLVEQRQATEDFAEAFDRGEERMWLH